MIKRNEEYCLYQINLTTIEGDTESSQFGCNKAKQPNSIILP